MKKTIGVVLVLIAVLWIVGVVVVVGTGRIAGNFLTGLILGAPALLVILIGTGLMRAGRKDATSFGEPDAQWTRNRIR